MNITKALLVLILATAAICGFLARKYASPKPPSLLRDSTAGEAVQPPRQVNFSVFNTFCQLTFHDQDSQRVNAASQEIMDRLTQLHHAINAYSPDSELSHLNRTAGDQPFSCSPLLWDVVLQARHGWKLSDGLFDATVGPLLHLWGFHAKKDLLPSAEDIQQAKDQVGFQFVRLDEQKHTVFFTRQGMKLDFGGIAKGYALSLAVSIAQRHQLQSYLIDLGGNIYCPPPGPRHPHPYRVGIRNPRKKDYIIGYVELRGQCIATSGNYERQRRIQGKTIGHIMDPRTGQPTALPEGYESVTAVTAAPTLSDVFSTTVFVGGEASARQLAGAVPGTGFVFVGFDASGSLEVSTAGPITFIPLE